MKQTKTRTERSDIRRLRGDQRGQSLAEMAIVLPLLLLLVFGIIEMALAWRVSQIITNVAREGARVAVLPSSNQGDVEARIEEGLEASGLTADADLIFGCGDEMGTICDSSGGETTVGIEYPYTFRLLGPLVELAGGSGDRYGQITLSSTSIMRRE